MTGRIAAIVSTIVPVFTVFIGHTRKFRALFAGPTRALIRWFIGTALGRAAEWVPGAGTPVRAVSICKTGM